MLQMTVLFASDWSTLVVAKMSPWLQTDSAVDAVRRNSEEVSNVYSVHCTLLYLFTVVELLAVSANAILVYRCCKVIVSE